MQTPLFHKIVNTMILSKWFWFGEGYSGKPEQMQLKDLTIEKIDKYINDNFDIPEDQIHSQGLVEKWIPHLHSLG